MALVVETIMIFALGFLAATLVALLIIPAINARAERLARRRAEALFPMSISELTAEKDHLRAEFAVLQRRIERKAEEALSFKHQSMEELGRRALRNDALESTIAERDGTIAGLQKDLAETRAKLADTEENLSTAKTALAGTRETLTAIENAHRKTLDELAITRTELERTKTGLADTRAELLLTQEKLEARDAEYAAFAGRHSGVLSELDTKRITISDLETRLATQTARADELERALNERRGELADERQRLADFAKNLLAEQERSLRLEQRTRELQAERDAKAAQAAALSGRLEELTGDGAVPEGAASSGEPAGREKDPTGDTSLLEGPSLTGNDENGSEARSSSNALATLKAEKASLEAALSAATAERARLESELQTLRGSGGASSEEIIADNADLRRRIVEVADQIMQVSSGKGADPRKRRSNAR
jgi:chromosome segregation ATPase